MRKNNMKMKIAGVFLLSLLLASLSACSAQSGPIAIRWINIKQVDVQHILGGQITEWSISERQQLDDFADWFDGLSVAKKQFAKGKSPGDEDGGEVYGFALNDDGGTTFSYIINGPDDFYILCNDAWYEVKNPSMPFSNDG